MISSWRPRMRSSAGHSAPGSSRAERRLQNIVLARHAAFVFPAIPFPDLFPAEPQTSARAAAVFRDEHHARRLERGAQAPPRGLVRRTETLLEIRHGLHVDGRRLREL